MSASRGNRAAINAIRAGPDLGSFQPDGRLREVDGFPFSPQRCPQRIHFEARGVDALGADPSAVVSLRVGNQVIEGYVLQWGAGADGQGQHKADKEECGPVRDHAAFPPTLCVFLHSVDAIRSADVPSVLQIRREFDGQSMLVVVQL
jgi:hypothetical protein